MKGRACWRSWRVRRDLLIVSLIIYLAAAAAYADSRTSSAQYDQSFAVAIGVDRYVEPSWKTLQYARSGALAVADLLRRKGFQVQVLLDEEATRHRILTVLTDLARKLGAGDRVLIYFAGHGYTETIGGTDWGYIVPHDGADVAGYISMRELQNISQQMESSLHQLFVMDACYGGLFAITRSRLASYARRPGMIEEFMRRKARQYITAGGKDQTVLDRGPSGHSVFTGKFLRAVGEGLANRDCDDVVTFAELASFLEKAASNQYQTPLHGTLPGDEGGSFLFAVDAPDCPEQPKQESMHERPAVRADAQRRGGDRREPTGRPLKAPQTYRIRQGAPQALDELGVTAAVDFTKVEDFPVATLIVSFSRGPGQRQAAFGAGTSLRFEADGVTLEGTVLEIDWSSLEMAFTLGLIEWME